MSEVAAVPTEAESRMQLYFICGLKEITNHNSALSGIQTGYKIDEKTLQVKQILNHQMSKLEDGCMSLALHPKVPPFHLINSSV
jgi:hypothetical protein